MRQTRLISLRDAHDVLIASALGVVHLERTSLLQARGLVLADDVVAPADVPQSPRALRSGYAVKAADTLDASVMSPIQLPSLPALVTANQELSPETDAILPHHAVRLAGPEAEVLATARPWDDVRRRGEDAARGQVLLASGAVLTGTRLAALEALSVTSVTVKQPRIALCNSNGNGTAVWLKQLVCAWGGLVSEDHAKEDAIAITDSPAQTDITTSIALQPGLGEAQLCIEAGRPPVIMLPKRTEASLALAYAVLLPVLDRLTGRFEPRAMLSLPIAEKIAVSPGVSNLALLARNATTWRVLAVGDLPLSAWVRADGFAVLGPECEGLPPGAPLNAQLMSE